LLDELRSLFGTYRDRLAFLAAPIEISITASSFELRFEIFPHLLNAAAQTHEATLPSL
jgi:hypothetical protein